MPAIAALKVRKAASVLMLVAGVALVTAWWLRPDGTAGPCVVVSRSAALADIPESSGLAISRRNPGVLWSHNDSGSAAVLFAIDPSGAVIGRVRVPIRTTDWEDISAARCGSTDCLYIADIGDNRSARRQVRIYRVPEPAPGDSEIAPAEVFNGAYADGPHNAEALFVVGPDLFIVTRDRNGALYKATMSARRDVTFQRIGELGLAAVTDGEASPDEKSVVVRTSHEAVLYRTTDLIAGRSVPYLRIPLDGLKEPQGEGVALDRNLLYLSSEGRPWRPGGRLVGLRCDLHQ